MTKQRFLAIIYLLIGIILPAMAQTFTEQKKTYPVSADGSKYVVSGFTSFSPASDEHIYANALLWTVENVCPKLREGITEANVPAKSFSCDCLLYTLRPGTRLASRFKAEQHLLLQSHFPGSGRQAGLLSL